MGGEGGEEQLGAPGSWALTSDPGSSRLSPGVARPLFTQGATRGPRSCRRARALPTPRRWGWGGGGRGRDSRPLPLRRRPPRPAGGFSAGEAPAPPPPSTPGPGGGGDSGRGGGRGGECWALRGRWRWEGGDGEGRDGPRAAATGGPARGPAEAWTCCLPLVRSVRALSLPAPPQPFRRLRGRKRGGSSPRLPSTFFFSLFPFPLGGGVGGEEEREGEADLQTPRLPQPSSESIVTRGPAAPSGPPLFKSFAPGGPARAAGSPRTPPGRLLSASVASPVLVTFSLSPRRRKLRPPLCCCVRLGTSSLREALAAEFQNNCSGRRK